MSDNLCGGSNALKRLGEHADRDRSFHQDRLVNSTYRNGNQSFRSNQHAGATATAAAEQSFANFQAGTLPIGPLGGGLIHPGYNGAGMLTPPVAPDQSNAWLEEYNVHGLATALHTTAGPNLATRQNNQHVAQGPVTSLAMNPAQMVGMSPHQQLPYMSTAYASSGLMTLNGSAYYGPGMMPAQQPASSATDMHTVNGNGGVPISEEALDRAFRLFDEEQSASVDMDEWLATHSPNARGEAAYGDAAQPASSQSAGGSVAKTDDSFQEAMDQWMAAHGPTAEQKADAVMEALATNMENQAALHDDVHVKESNETAKEQAEMQAADREELEKFRQERAERDELRRTAGEIVSSIGENDKFQSSIFLQLMRKIVEGEVILDKEISDLVDAKTMKPLTNSFVNGGGDSAALEEGNAPSGLAPASASASSD